MSPLELDFLWESLDAGEPPYPLEIRSHGATEDERAALRRQVSTDAHTERLLAVLARPRQSIDSVFLPALGAEPVRALAAATSSSAVLAVQRGESLALRPIHPGGLVSAIVELLPPAPRGTELSISVPAAEFNETFGRLATLPGLRGGQIAANTRSHLGMRRRSPVLAWFDNESGRYLGQVDHQDWLTVAPADAPALRGRLSEMMTGVTDTDR